LYQSFPRAAKQYAALLLSINGNASKVPTRSGIPPLLNFCAALTIPAQIIESLSSQDAVLGKRKAAFFFVLSAG